jgi:DNA polymerase-4
VNRHVVCFEIPAFEIAVARLQDSSLRHRPVAVAPIQRMRVGLHEVSVEALREGLAVGMSLDHARRLCPSIRLIPPDPLRVRAAEQQLTNVICRFAPIWEPVQPGHLFLDLTGTTRLFGPAIDTAARVEQEIHRQYGLTGVLGVATNKLVSQAAATVIQPSHLCDVLPGCEPTFMAPLPVSCLPRLNPGSSGTVWPKILAVLEDLNLRTLGEIAEIPPGQLERACGPYARVIHDRARGIDPSPVFLPMQRPHVQLSVTLDPDEVDDEHVLGVLYGLVEELCRQLRRQGRMSEQLRLRLTHTDHEEVSGICTLRSATFWEVDMFPALSALFHRLFQRRVRIRAVTLKAERLGTSEEQLSLFDVQASPFRQRMQQVARALDTLRDRFGPSVVRFGRTV